MRRLRKGGLAILTTALVLGASLLKPALAQTDFDIKPTESTTFIYGGKTLKIWDSLTNESQHPNNPELWQFRYAPILMPEVKNGSLNFIQTPSTGTGPFRLSLKIYFSTPSSTARALAAVQALYPPQASQINSNNIASLSIASINSLT
jgi:hypothetical protein